MFSRRSFLSIAGAAAASPVLRLSAQRGRAAAADNTPVPPSIAALTSMRDRAKPITNEERAARIERARRLMAEQPEYPTGRYSQRGGAGPAFRDHRL